MDMDEWLNLYFGHCEAYNHDHDDEWYEKLPEVTLSPPIGMAHKTYIAVLKQRSYTGRKPVIPSTLADTLCSDLGIQGVLAKLNITLGTSYTLFTPWIYSVLGDCILEDYDFGTAFAYLRPYWGNGMTTIVDDLRKRKVLHQEMLQDVLVEDKIIYPGLPPRRVWDLCSNRVVPWWVAQQQPWGISHAWMDEEDRENVTTTINGREWPVSIPKGTSLDLVRIEMLNLGAEYAWLDVLCLRQKGGLREDLREEEWKVDVPTIGSVYDRADRVVCYLSGLGRPLSSDADNLESERCWFKRAWTLQEISEDSMIGGDTSDEQLWAKFQKHLSSLKLTTGIYGVLSEMGKRVSTNPVDKIAGMSYLLGSDTIPAYYGEQSEEDAWTALMDAASGRHLADLLFCHPEPGPKSWRPSWKQVMSETVPLRLRPAAWTWVRSSFIEGVKIDSFPDGYIIESALVRGLSERDSQLEGRERHGKLVVEEKTGTQRTFKIVAYHQWPIPDGLYTLLGAESMLHWVVGLRLADQQFKKLSIFEVDDGSEDTVRFALWSIARKVPTTYLA